MSERSVKTYIQSQLDGLTVATVAQPLVCFTELSAIYIPAQPTVWLWSRLTNEKREAGNRGTGYKRVDYQLSLVLLWDIDQAQPGMDVSQFEDLVWLVRNALRTMTVQKALSDSITGESSTLMNIGENIRVTKEPPNVLEDQALIRYAAEIRCDAYELVTG